MIMKLRILLSKCYKIKNIKINKEKFLINDNLKLGNNVIKRKNRKRRI